MPVAPPVLLLFAEKQVELLSFHRATAVLPKMCLLALAFTCCIVMIKAQMYFCEK